MAELTGRDFAQGALNGAWTSTIALICNDLMGHDNIFGFKTFKTMHEAALEAMSDGHKFMSMTKTEWGGEIYKNNDGYYYTSRPGPDSTHAYVYPDRPGVVGIWHAHPSPELAPLYATELYSYPTDVDQSIPAYLITGKGKIMLYLPNDNLIPELGEFYQYDCSQGAFKQMNSLPIW